MELLLVNIILLIFKPLTLLFYITDSTADFVNQLSRPLKATMAIFKNLHDPSDYFNL